MLHTAAVLLCLMSLLASSVGAFQLRAEIKSIDTKLTTTSMKLIEEKNLLRRKDSIKTRLKDLAGFESCQKDVQALKVGTGQPAYVDRFAGRVLCAVDVSRCKHFLFSSLEKGVAYCVLWRVEGELSQAQK